MPCSCLDSDCIVGQSPSTLEPLNPPPWLSSSVTTWYGFRPSMAKKPPTDAAARGEQLLHEWNVPDEVDALRAAWGRDPEADHAIAARLGHHQSHASATVLL